MTAPTQAVAPWDAPVDPKADAASRLSRMVAGNDALVAHPGLVQALFEQNATPQQAQAINEFVLGLEAEKKVRLAAAAGEKIPLTQRAQDALTGMGVDYQPVLFTHQDAVSQLTSQMAAKGLKPVLDDNGNPKLDKSGNIVAEKIEQPKPSGGRGFFGTIGHYLGSVVMHGDFSGNNGVVGQPDAGVSGLVHVASSAFNLTNTAFSETAGSRDPADAVHTAQGNAELMKRLGYDPDSVMSTLAFNARGYAHNDTSNAADDWDRQNPNGLFGWDGAQAVTEAEAFATDPTKYRRQIENDPTLNPQQVADRVKAISSEPFQSLVARVNGEKSDVGTDFARGIGIDPVKHPTAFNYTAAGANFAASFLIDPTAVGLGAFQGARVSATAVRNIADSEDVRNFFTGASASMAQSSVRAYLNHMVDYGNQFREAETAGDEVRKARIVAAADRNPFGALLEDFTGRNQIVGMKSEAELQGLGKGDVPYRVGAGEPIDTYDKAVDYLASKSALLKLTGGYAPTQASVMPGALSSYGYTRLRSSLAAWSAGRSAARSVSAADRFAGWASADPMREADLIKQGLLARYQPQADDAVDVLSGQVLASRATGELAPEAGGLASAKRAANSDLLVTDAGRGAIRSNMLSFGRPTAPAGVQKALTTLESPDASRLQRFSAQAKVMLYGIPGIAQRAKLAASRFANWLPRDTNIDIESAASADTIGKIGRTYLTSGDAALLKARWVAGNAQTRKTIVEGLRAQIAHAAGLTRTKAGRELLDRWETQDQHYATNGFEVLDPNGRAAAQWPGQVQTKFALPNFGAVHKAAAKVGLFEATIGRLLGSAPMDKLLTQWKLGALATPVTALRASIETWLNSAADGMFVKGVRAKALLREMGKLDHPLVHRSRGVNAVLSLAPLAAAGRFYRHAMLARMPEGVAREITNLADDLFDGYIHEQSMGHFLMEVDPGGVGRISEIAENGLTPVRAKYATEKAWSAALRSRKGYELTDEVDGLAGANAYAHGLATRVNDAPHVARAVLDAIEKPGEFDVQHVVKALDATPRMHDTMYGKVFWREDGTQANAVTDADRALGKEQWARQITEEFRSLITGRNGHLNDNIAAYIRKHGKAPDADWILDRVKGMARPEKLLRPVYDAVPQKDGVRGALQAMLDAEGKGYQWLVERLIQRHATSPLFAAAYGDAKVGLERFKQGLIDNGLSEESAERVAQVHAAGQAWARIARMVDDPRMKSQMDVVGRSFFAFSRATTMMLRRWGTTLWRNPVAARRMMLAAEAAEHSGLVYQDENGQWMFSFPASGVAQEVLMHAMSHIPGFEGLAQFPASDFEGRVASIIPGSNNPFQYQTTPMVSIAMRQLATLTPTMREDFDLLDRKLNGSQGAGQGVVATILPNLAKKIYDSGAVPFFRDGDPRNSYVASATVGALFNLYAAGLVPKDGASPSEIDDFFSRLDTHTRSQLALRALLSAFSPASIASPDNETEASLPDYAFAVSGSKGLSDEYKRLLNDVDGDYARATAIFTALHPDKTVFEQSGSESTTPKAFLPATQAAYKWLNANRGFIDKYKSVAAYFLPPPTGDAPFSMDAYRAQLETGLRQKKTPQEFLDGVRVSTAANVYYAVEDQYKKDVAAAKAAGDDDAVKSNTADWLAWSKQFKATHASFAGLVDKYGDERITAKGQLADLRQMVKNGDVPGSAVQKEAVSRMLQAYDGYEQFIAAHPGRDAVNSAARSAAQAQLQDFMTAVTKAQPGLTDVYNAVFRVLDTNLDYETTEGQ